MCTLARELMKTMHEYKFILFVKEHIFLSFTFSSSLKGVFCYFFGRLIWFIFENSLETMSFLVKDIVFACCGVAVSLNSVSMNVHRLMLRRHSNKVWWRHKLWGQDGKKEKS